MLACYGCQLPRHHQHVPPPQVSHKAAEEAQSKLEVLAKYSSSVAAELRPQASGCTRHASALCQSLQAGLTASPALHGCSAASESCATRMESEIWRCLHRLCVMPRVLTCLCQYL